MRKRKNMFSIVQNIEDFNNRICYRSGAAAGTELHHIFGASNKANSEKYGLLVYLRHDLHNEPPDGVHHNKKANLKLKQAAQRAFMANYPNEDFLKIFGRNYL